MGLETLVGREDSYHDLYAIIFSFLKDHLYSEVQYLISEESNRPIDDIKYGEVMEFLSRDENRNIIKYLVDGYFNLPPDTLESVTENIINYSYLLHNYVLTNKLRENICNDDRYKEMEDFINNNPAYQFINESLKAYDKHLPEMYVVPLFLWYAPNIYDLVLTKDEMEKVIRFAAQRGVMLSSSELIDSLGGDIEDFINKSGKVSSPEDEKKIRDFIYNFAIDVKMYIISYEFDQLLKEIDSRLN